MANYWIVGAWNIRHAVRNGIAGEWALTLVHKISEGDKALVYVLGESRHNPSGKASGCFVGDLTIKSGADSTKGYWIWADHISEKEALREGFSFSDFRLWRFFVSADEARKHGAEMNLRLLKAERGMVPISREAYLKIVDAYSDTVERESEDRVSA